MDESTPSVQWVWLTAGSCALDSASQLPGHWFKPLSSSASGTQSVQSLSGEPWRASVLNSLRQNNRKTEGEAFKEFAPAVERTSWVKGGACRVNFGGAGGKWEACTLELEQTGTTRGEGTASSSGVESEIDFGTLSVFGAKNKNKVNCVMGGAH